MTTFDNTIKALAVYDSNKEHRDRLFNSITEGNYLECEQKYEEWQKVELEDLLKVQTAFWEDTKEYNSLDNCKRVDIFFMRRVASPKP